MKQSSFIMLAVAILWLSSCGKKEQSTDIIVEAQPEEAPSATPTKMHEFRSATSVGWLGKTYRVIVERKVDTTLPVITDDTGTKYYDNRITMSVLRSDSTTFFTREFVKTDFSEWIEQPGYIEKSALLGFVLEKADGDNLQFAASVGDPDVLSDEYVPLIITLSRMGKLTITKDSRLDLLEETEDEGV